MDINHFIDKYKNHTVSIVVILAALIFANNIYQAQSKDIARLKADKDVEIKKNELITGIDSLEKKIDKYKKLLNNKTSSSVINALNNIAKESGVSITSLKPAEEKIAEFYTTYSFSVDVEADKYNSLGRFINKLESSPDIYIIDTLSIDKNTDSESANNKLSAKIGLSTIILRE